MTTSLLNLNFIVPKNPNNLGAVRAILCGQIGMGGFSDKEVDDASWTLKMFRDFVIAEPAAQNLKDLSDKNNPRVDVNWLKASTPGFFTSMHVPAQSAMMDPVVFNAVKTFLWDRIKRYVPSVPDATP